MAPGSPLASLNLAFFSPGGPEAPVLFATCGASLYKMSDGRRVEALVILARQPPAEHFEPLRRLLASFALFAEASGQTVQLGDVVRAEAELAPLCGMDAVLFVPPLHIPAHVSSGCAQRNGGRRRRLVAPGVCSRGRIRPAAWSSGAHDAADRPASGPHRLRAALRRLLHVPGRRRRGRTTPHGASDVREPSTLYGDQRVRRRPDGPPCPSRERGDSNATSGAEACAKTSTRSSTDGTKQPTRRRRGEVRPGQGWGDASATPHPRGPLGTLRTLGCTHQAYKGPTRCCAQKGGDGRTGASQSKACRHRVQQTGGDDHAGQ